MSAINTSSTGIPVGNMKPLFRGSDYVKQLENVAPEITDLGNGVVVERRGALFKMTGDAKMSLRAKVTAYEAAKAGGKAGQAMFDTYRKTHPEEFGDAAVARDKAIMAGQFPEPPPPPPPAGERVTVEDGGSYTATGAGPVNLTGGRGVTATGSAANDFLAALHNAVLFGLGGNDTLSAWDDSTLDGGEGDDVLRAYEDSTLSGGAGNDRLSAGYNAVADGGEGDDRIEVYSGARVTDSGGDNDISTYGHASVTTGAGNDRITAGDGSVVKAGDGINYVHVGAGATVTSGSGDDYVHAGWGSEVTAGGGDDRVVVGGGVTVRFNRGDGHDVIDVGSPGLLSPSTTDRLATSTVAFGPGIQLGDVSIQRSGDDLVVGVGDDSVTLRDVAHHGVPTMTFADGSMLGAEQVQALADQTTQRLRSAARAYQTQVVTTGTAL